MLTDLVAALAGEPPGALTPIGEGTDHRSYITESGLVVRVAKATGPGNGAALLHEAALLRMLGQLVSIAVPHPLGVDPDAGVLVYRHVDGTPLLDAPPADRQALARDLGQMLTELHGVEPPVGTGVDRYAMEAWLQDAATDYQSCGPRLAPAMRRAVEAFLAAAPPTEGTVEALCHNDLGAEHLLIDPTSRRLTGVIDWTDAALTDPCRDLGRLFRDLGQAATDSILDSYGHPLDDGAWQRIVFHARCALLEDAAYGIGSGDDRYTRAALESFAHVFSAS